MKIPTKSLFALALLVFAGSATAQTDTDVDAQITNRVQTSAGFWRYDFTYTTTDIDGETPVTLSAAIFMNKYLHDKETQAPGCVLLNHYTITDDASAPTSINQYTTHEGIMTLSGYFLIESDGIGFGLTRDRKQPYLVGRVNAKNDIDAFIAGRKLLEQEGFTFGDIVANVGYSSGANTGMWVSKLVEEGYRNDELPYLNLTMVGGGPYDIPAHYRYMLEKGTSSYPVAMPLILYGLTASGADVKEEDVFSPAVLPHLAEWFDTKQHVTTHINDSIFALFGDTVTREVEISYLVTPEFLDSTSELMQRVMPEFEKNSVVYDGWTPTKTLEMYFFHSKNDPTVPYVNMQSLDDYLQQQGYTHYTVQNTLSTGDHTEGAYYFPFLVVGKLVIDDITGISNNVTIDEYLPKRIFLLDGTEVPINGSFEQTRQQLKPGIYIIDHKKVIIR